MIKVFLEFHLLKWAIIPYYFNDYGSSYNFVFLFITLKIKTKE